MKQISTYSKMNAHLLTHTHISRMALYAAFLFIGVMCSVGNAWGAETLVYTLDGTTTGGTNGYAEESDINQSEKAWKVTGNTTMNPWRIGGKKLTSDTERTIYNVTSSLTSDNISTVVLSHGTFSDASKISVSSVKLIVSTASDGSGTKISEISRSFKTSDTIQFHRPSGVSWASRYFKIVYTITTDDTNNNRYFTFNYAKFYKEDAPSCTEPTVSATGNSSVTCTSATVTCTDGGSPAKGIVKGSCNTDEWGFFVKAGSAPTDASYDSKVVVGDESSSDSYIAAFSTSLTGLTPGTTYYVKAYAKVGATYALSSTGTSFTTSNPTISFSVPSGVTPIANKTASNLLPEPSGTPTGINEDCWTFVGWTESSSVNSNSKPATLYPSGIYYNGSNTSNFTLYAVYSRNRYKVIFDESEFEANEYYVITYYSDGHEYAVKASLTGNNANVTDIIDLTTEIQADGGYYYHINNPSEDVIWKLTGDEDEWRLSNGSLYWNLSNSSNAILQESGADIEIAQETDNNRFTFTDATTSSNNLTISSSNASITSTATNAYVYKRESTLYMTSPEDPTYTITWKVSGQSDESSDIEATGAMDDSDIPDDPTALICTDAFVGWSTKSAGAESKTTSYYDDLFTSAADAPYLTGDATFYAVFATSGGGSSSGGITQSEVTSAAYGKSAGSYGSQSASSASGNWTGRYAFNTENEKKVMQINASVGNSIISPTFSGVITHIAIVASNKSSSESRSLYIKNGDNSLATLTYSASTSEGTQESDISGSYTSFVITASNALYINSITVTYTSYSDYKTACVVPYDIVLDDGEVATTNNGSAKVAADAKELIDITAPTKTGYKVAKYTTGNGSGSDIADKDGKLNASVSVSATVWTNSSKEWKKGSGATFYASWTPISYSVRFNANDEGKAGTASGSMSNQDFDYGTAQNLTTNAFSLTGYTFQGWATSAGGSVAHTDGKSVSNLSTTDGDVVDLYAVWQANTYDVTLAATDETSSVGSQTVHATFGSAMPLVTTADGTPDVEAPSRTGYTFDGWEYSLTQYYSYDAGEEEISSAHVWDIANSTTTLTPRWNVNSYTLTWDKNGGNALTGDYTSGSVNYGATITAPNTPTRSGYDFAGWDDGSGVVTPATTMPAGDVTYTATWTKKTASGWTWTYNSAAIPDPFVIYVGINKTLDITWDPSDLLSEMKGYTVTKTDSYVAQGAKANDYYTMRGTAGVKEVTNTTVTFSLSGLSDVEINVTVKPQPRVHFVDNIHGESFNDLLPTVVSYVATFTKSTPTHSDVSDPGSDYNSCERQHIHLVGWIRSDWANEHPGASHLQITSAGNDDAGNPYYYTAGADIDVEAQDGQTFYAVWSKIE